MAFISTSFVIFLTVTAAAYYILPLRFRPALLLAASLYFYYLAAPQYILWLALSVVAAYAAALAVNRAQTERAKTLWSAAGIVLLVGSLVYFKYFDFFVSSVASLLGRASPVTEAIIAPVGISFYTLQAVGYIVDVRRGELAPERDPVVFAAYITFFPHIMSGPIAKASRLLPQFRAEHKFNAEVVWGGARRFLLGVFKKAVIAEPAAAFVNAAYYDIARENPATVAAAALLYSLYLYFDFSAYTDMALGAGAMLGFELGENFRAPYFSKSITEIWSRWHISLTSWLRENVYFPLGGSRRGYARKLLNISAVFLISGLWHGADWGYLAWGAFFALARSAEELASRYLRPHLKPSRALSALGSVFSRVYVYLMWSFSLVFFRLENLGSALAALSKIFDFSSWSLSAFNERAYLIMMSLFDSSPAFAKAALFTSAAFALLLLALEYFYVYLGRARTEKPNDLLAQLPDSASFALGLIMLCAALAFGFFGSSSFVYFQF